MTFLLETHTHKLRFRVDNNAPKLFMNRWKDFKNLCESRIGHPQKTFHNLKIRDIIEKIKYFCTLESNKNLPFLDRCEGGVGGNNNLIHKQLRFRHDFCGMMILDNDIVLDIFNAEEKWTYKELDDLVASFIKTSNYYMTTECVTGSIEMINENHDDTDEDYE